MHTGAMVALIPTAQDAQRLAVEGGEPAEQLHVTLLYLGDGADFTPEARADVLAAVTGVVAGMPAVTADAFAVDVFNPASADRDTAIALGLSGGDLADAHCAVAEAVLNLQSTPAGFTLPEQHEPWIPHLTLVYSDDLSLVPTLVDRTGPILFDRIRVAFAGEHTDIPLTPPEPEPRAFGGTFLPSRSDPMPDERQPTDTVPGTQFTRAFTEPGRNLMDEPPGTPIEFTASTPGVKRDGLDLRASGWRVENFLRSPVVLWCHDLRSVPLGTAAAAVEPDRLRTPVTFDQEDDFARRVESKVRRGIIRGCSVQWDFVDAGGHRIDGWRMSMEQLRDEAFYDLLELSIVPVPADPMALAARQRTALRTLGHELVALFDEQERVDSDVTGSDLRAAVRAELVRIGLDLDGLAAEGRRLTEDGRRLAGEMEELPLLESGPLVATVDEQALARAIRSAFGDVLKVDDRQPATGGPVNTTIRLVGETGPETVILPWPNTAAVTANTLTVRTDTPPDDEPPTAGVREPADTPVPPTQDSAARAVVDNDAAQVLLAAFNI